MKKTVPNETAFNLKDFLCNYVVLQKVMPITLQADA